jgi:coproporphyrinogen dehydrogenase HemZ
MIYVKLEEDFFRYEVQDLLKLFFPGEPIITMTGAVPHEDPLGVFLICRVIKSGENSSLEISIHTKDYNNNAKVSMYDEHTVKCSHEVRRTIKREFKRQLYILLSEYTGKRQPWGMLTGIRPAKIVHEMINRGHKKEEIIQNLTDYYMVANNKAKLLYDVAVVEKKILDRTSPKMISLYIGIPFCPTRCLYCSFTSNPISRYGGAVKKYIDALKLEIEGISKIIIRKALKIQSIYIGGGTPTAIDNMFLEELLKIVEDYFDVSNVEEYTVEAGRPDSIDEEKLSTIKRSKVSRISINPQTMNNETLRLIGRCHNSEDIVNAFNLARKLGFDNINMDVIVGLPRENIAMFENTMSQIEKLSPESLTVHSMAIKRASRLNENREKFELLNSDEANKMIETAQKYAAKMGMHPYYLYRQKNTTGNLENIGYCKQYCESVYNVQIMEEKQSIFAFGAGAITKIVYPEENRIERAFNVKGVEEYISRVEEMIERKKVLIGG